MRRETRAQRYARAVHNAKVLSNLGLGPKKPLTISSSRGISAAPRPLPPLVSVKHGYFVTTFEKGVYIYRQRVGSTVIEGLLKSEEWGVVPALAGRVAWVGYDFKTAQHTARALYYTTI